MVQIFLQSEISGIRKFCTKEETFLSVLLMTNFACKAKYLESYFVKHHLNSFFNKEFTLARIWSSFLDNDYGIEIIFLDFKKNV